MFGHKKEHKEAIRSGEYYAVASIGFTTAAIIQPGLQGVIDLVANRMVIHRVWDKVVGLAAAYLWALCKVRYIWGETMSEAAYAYLKKRGMTVEFDTLVPQILRKDGAGICPMEEKALSAKDAVAFYRMIAP
ncbi:MAG: DUF1893 domain-containing protein [Oscillospiraceae bacterium]|jgi:MFS-type transporter involved in bile tolerance (Atg22 family)|nr:DUF1893 domain-containing protein [Oscillospiraceae bacterium]